MPGTIAGMTGGKGGRGGQAPAFWPRLRRRSCELLSIGLDDAARVATHAQCRVESSRNPAYPLLHAPNPFTIPPPFAPPRRSKAKAPEEPPPPPPSDPTTQGPPPCAWLQSATRMTLHLALARPLCAPWAPPPAPRHALRDLIPSEAPPPRPRQPGALEGFRSRVRGMAADLAAEYRRAADQAGGPGEGGKGAKEVLSFELNKSGR